MVDDIHCTMEHSRAECDDSCYTIVLYDGWVELLVASPDRHDNPNIDFLPVLLTVLFALHVGSDDMIGTADIFPRGLNRGKHHIGA